VPLRVEESESPSFQKALTKLRKRFRHIDADLARAYTEIAADPDHACHARMVPAFGVPLWKYRARSNDMRRGKSGGFRIIAYKPKDRDVLFPFMIYTHVDYQEQPPRDQIRSALEELLGVLREKQPGLFDDQEIGPG